MSVRFGVLLIPAIVGSCFAAVEAQTRKTAAAGVYTQAQAARGLAVYEERCSACHGPMLRGAQAPPLAGEEFLKIWGGPLSDLAAKIQSTMPANNPGALTLAQTADLVAYILKVGKFPAGSSDLAADEAALKTIALQEPSTPSRKAPAKASTAQLSSRGASGLRSGLGAFQPVGNMAQLMRAILFPASNLIFNVQTHDPAAPRAASTPDTAAGFSWADWGAGIYTGWELVDYAAVALAESAPLMLTPGRRCENGKPVPVNDPDWIRFSVELAEAGRAALKASQTRKQDVVSDFTDQLTVACSNCHQAYRDKPVRGARNPIDPSNKAARCVR